MIKQVTGRDKGFRGGAIACGTVQQAKNLLTIVKKSQDSNFESDLLVGKIKKQKWKALGIVAELPGNGDTCRTFNMVADRGDMLEADRGDLKKIWDALH